MEQCAVKQQMGLLRKLYCFRSCHFGEYLEFNTLFYYLFSSVKDTFYCVLRLFCNFKLKIYHFLLTIKSVETLNIDQLSG